MKGEHTAMVIFLQFFKKMEKTTGKRKFSAQQKKIFQGNLFKQANAVKPKGQTHGQTYLDR